MRRVTALDEDAILWSHPESQRAGRPLIVFLHGYYGRESDWNSSFAALPDGAVGATLRGPVPVSDRWAWAEFGARRVPAAERG
ncbi:hypothetical protein [Naasia aerilata]|uniref:Alpha/beta hydrolase n=1 Tax=Naasia aerilata TaxID=1162966 RepID=A0ABM8GC08_9MICO|nr:hypothetical protein [Naasia aerilata]BDZ45780.1 hypothetical protein GCM10025866_16890 [Naasia aerilata]